MYITVRLCTKVENTAGENAASSAGKLVMRDEFERCLRAGFKFYLRVTFADVLVHIHSVLLICRSATQTGPQDPL
jgi:hypothetical protein